MRVLYSFPMALGGPGVGTTALNEVRGLVDAGLDVHVVCASAVGEVPGARVTRTLQMAGLRIPHRAFGSTQRGYDMHDRLTAAILHRRGARYDVVHVWPRGCLRTAAAAQRAGVPVLREVPSPHTHAAFSEARRAASSLGLTLPAGHSHAWDDAVLAREEAEYRAADALLVPSDYARSTFLSRGFDPRRLLAVRYGYDPRRFMPRDERAARTGLSAVFLGRGEPNKGLHHALRAWIASGAAQVGTLDVCGMLWAPYAHLLEEELAHPGVRVRGFVDASAVLREADVLLLPTWTEGSALVGYEAIGSGCVPLVSTASGVPVVDHVSGLVHAVADEQVLTGQLRMLLDRPDELARLRAGALEAAPGLTWQAAASRLVAAYEEALTLPERDGSTRRALSE